MGWAKICMCTLQYLGTLHFHHTCRTNVEFLFLIYFSEGNWNFCMVIRAEMAEEILSQQFGERWYQGDSHSLLIFFFFFLLLDCCCCPYLGHHCPEDLQQHHTDGSTFQFIPPSTSNSPILKENLLLCSVLRVLQVHEKLRGRAQRTYGRENDPNVNGITFRAK